MKIISVYPVIRINVIVPDDYEGTIENEMNLRADFRATTFDAPNVKLGDCELCGWSNEDEL